MEGRSLTDHRSKSVPPQGMPNQLVADTPMKYITYLFDTLRADMLRTQVTHPLGCPPDKCSLSFVVALSLSHRA